MRRFAGYESSIEISTKICIAWTLRLTYAVLCDCYKVTNFSWYLVYTHRFHFFRLLNQIQLKIICVAMIIGNCLLCGCFVDLIIVVVYCCVNVSFVFWGLHLVNQIKYRFIVCNIEIRHNHFQKVSRVSVDSLAEFVEGMEKRRIEINNKN